MDFVGALDKFSAIGLFDADSPSAPPPTCVQIEGFRESCDIPPQRCGKDRENVKNEEQTDRRERREARRDGKVGRVKAGWYANVSLRKSGRTVRLLCGNFSELECLPRLALNQGPCVSFPNVDEATCLLTCSGISFKLTQETLIKKWRLLLLSVDDRLVA